MLATKILLNKTDLPIFTKVNLLIHIAPELGDIYLTDNAISIGGNKPIRVNNISTLAIHDIIYKEEKFENHKS
jgi:hypothetical protein